MNTAEKKDKKTRKFTHSCYFHKCNEILHLIVECHCSGAEETQKESERKAEEPTQRRVSFQKIQEVPGKRLRRPSRDPAALNYTLMEKYLRDENSPHRGKLLQAIRWRLTDNEVLGAKTAREVVKSDFLGVRKFTGRILETLLWTSERKKETHHLQNSTARFLNALTIYPEGTEYLAKASVVESLTFGEQFALISLNRQFVDPHTAGQLLATMRRLSSRPEIAREMLSRSFLAWIIEYLEEIEYSGSEYQIREALELLSSLLSHPEAFNEDLFTRTGQFLALLARYLNRSEKVHSGKILKITQILISRPEIATIAKSMDFEKILIPPAKIETQSITEQSSRRKIDPEIDEKDPICEIPGLEGEVFLEEHFAEVKVTLEKPEVNKAPEKSSQIPVRTEKSGKKKGTGEATKSPPRRSSKKDILSDSDPEITQALRNIFPGDQD